MTLMCIERSQSPTHNGTFLPGRKSPVKNSNTCISNNNNNNNSVHQQNANNNNNSNNHHHHKRNSVSPPLPKSQQQHPPPDSCNNNNNNSSNSNNKGLESSSKKLDRSCSEPADRRAVPSNSSRYKTELCRPFEENGTCKYGDKCQFAHGSKELRSMARHPKYKTELCRTFHSTGLCPYGPRCHFIHMTEEFKKSLLSNLTTQAPPARSSLGSAGDISPPNSLAGTPTLAKTFSYDHLVNPMLNGMANVNHPNFNYSPVPELQSPLMYLAEEQGSDSQDAWGAFPYGSQAHSFDGPLFSHFAQDETFSRWPCFPRIPTN